MGGKCRVNGKRRVNLVVSGQLLVGLFAFGGQSGLGGLCGHSGEMKICLIEQERNLRELFFNK